MQLENSAEASSQESTMWTHPLAPTRLKAAVERGRGIPVQAQTATPLVRRVYAQGEVSDRFRWRASTTLNKGSYGRPIQESGDRAANPVNDDFVGLSNGGRGVSLRSNPENWTTGQRQPFEGRGSFGAAGTRVGRGEGGGMDAGRAVWTPSLWSQRSEQHDREERRKFLEQRAKRDGGGESDVFIPSVVGTHSIAKETAEASISGDGMVGMDIASLERQRRRERKFAFERGRISANNPAPAMGRERGRGRRRAEVAVDYVDEDLGGAKRRMRKREKLDKGKAVKRTQSPAIPILLPEFISVANLARVLKVRTEDFIKRMEVLGFEDTRYDHILNSETAGLIAMEYNYEPIAEHSDTEDLRPRQPADDKSLLAPRPPVVTIMGHVDHGKTTILDWLRNSSVAASEHGGITQHIGAFSVSMPSGKLITFLDTPGHAAFLSMRQRGANVTDVVILVVAADDSVKPQTVEAIKHAKNAKVPIVVAISKIDKEEANVERVKFDLARHGIEVEDFGGDTQVVCVSGKTGQGMGDLEESVVTLSEILDLRAETTGPVEGWVIEASTKKEGRVATVLVRRGTLRGGDVIVAGSTWARVRRLRNEAGVEVAEAGPGTPVEIDGWKEQPSAGDEVLQALSEGKAKRVVELRVERAERFKLAEDMEAINDSRKAEQERRVNSANRANGSEVESEQRSGGSKLKEVCFIIKGDVSGSVEAVLNSVLALGNDEVRPHVLRSGVGPVGEFDLEHAAAAGGERRIVIPA
jgi:translation initiation factor IF-2